MNASRPSNWFSRIAPGVLVAATGVGAGDVLTASLAGSKLHLVILWAVIIGGVLKLTINEGLARWQMATGTTLLEGWVEHLGGWIRWLFLAYLLVWTVATGGALMKACGVAGVGLFGGGDNGVVLWGIVHSALGLVLVWWGGYQIFEKLMGACIGLMFAAVMLTAVLQPPPWDELVSGILVPRVPPGGGGFVLGLVGGVGGSLTLLSYGYWIRQTDRDGARGVRACRTDLTVGYTMTVFFGLAMVLIGSRVELPDVAKAPPEMALLLADQLAGGFGSLGRWAFLVGFWGAVFSSLLGVWQSVPYMFADFVSMLRPARGEGSRDKDLAKTPAYRWYLLAIAIVPIPLLWVSLTFVVLTYAVLGALFMPLVAFTLLLMNNRATLVGRQFKNGPFVNTILVATLLFFAYQCGQTLIERFGGAAGG